jgi:DNA-binding transcriptional MerR regulator
MKKFATTSEVANTTGCSRQAVIVWAKKNGVQKHGNAYIWSAEDIARFKKRPGPGRPWHNEEDWDE